MNAPSCHSANTPEVSGAAAISGSVKGRFGCLIDMMGGPSSQSGILRPENCADTCRISATNPWSRHCCTPLSLTPRRRTTMPVKPNGNLCSIREQIVEDVATGLILQFECVEGRARLVIAGEKLPFGNREILFDQDGRESAAGTQL